MSLEFHWQTQLEGETRLVNIQTEFAVLQLSLSGRLIRESCWLLEPDCLKAEEFEFMRRLKHFLENPESEPLSLTLLEQGSEYRRRVWLELTKIAYGETMTYTALAKRLNSGPRAVANACRDNPFPGIIPCHRVVSVCGIGGFMGQSQGEFVELKRKILQYEAAKRQSTRLV